MAPLANIGRFVLKHKYLFTIAFFLLVVGLLDNNSLFYRYQLHQRNQEMIEQIANYDKQYEADSERMRELSQSPKAVEDVARVSLVMKKDNEDVYLIEEQK
ncbi:FtsB family cell division protein [Alloprevotella rava]|uniref:Septum formation initiator n=2 Tax=Alloprevotella rava TaxID=671218 RepID=G5GA89_9BACT|nr:septum formation initiator family protein [Alloprevotella rava]EHG24289.1 hypothetical protein HMPREF9332_00490 [Alloprevotella rava F0323]MBB3702596.1 hypothetical protein [Alloprevotella rava]